MVPFLGYMPNIFAALVELTSTNLFRLILPFLTPSENNNSILFSIAGWPFGILEKSCSPIFFCSHIKGQWSVATTCTVPWFKPAHKVSWSFFSRKGGLITHFADSKPLSYKDASSTKYCMQV